MYTVQCTFFWRFVTEVEVYKRYTSTHDFIPRDCHRIMQSPQGLDPTTSGVARVSAAPRDFSHVGQNFFDKIFLDTPPL